MSIKIMSQVWEYEWKTSSEQLIVLAMADWADDDGNKIFPSIDRVAWKVGVEKRTVQRMIAVLKSSGVLTIVSPARHHRPTEYRLDLSRGVKKSPFIPESLRGDIDEGVTNDASRGDIDDTSGVTFRALRGDTHATLSTIEPSVEPPVESPVLRKQVSQQTNDSLWGAVAEVTGITNPTKAEASSIGKAARELREVGATPDEVRRRADVFHRRYPKRTLMAWNLSAEWSSLNDVGLHALSAAKKEEYVDPMIETRRLWSLMNMRKRGQELSDSERAELERWEGN